MARREHRSPVWTFVRPGSSVATGRHLRRPADPRSLLMSLANRRHPPARTMPAQRCASSPAARHGPPCGQPWGLSARRAVQRCSGERARSGTTASPTSRDSGLGCASLRSRWWRRRGPGLVSYPPRIVLVFRSEPLVLRSQIVGCATSVGLAQLAQLAQADARRKKRRAHAKDGVSARNETASGGSPLPRL